MANSAITSDGKAIVDHLIRLKKAMCAVGAAVGNSAAACPPVAPSVSCSTVKCCTTDCSVVFYTKCTTTEVITIPGEPGDGTDGSCVKDCCGNVSFGPAGGAVPCTYETGPTTEKESCTDATGATIACPADLIPNCNPDRVDIIINPNPVCIQGEAEGECIENVTQLIKIEYDCIVPKDPICHGYLVDGVVVPCDEVTEIECPRYITLENSICLPEIIIPEPCTYVQLKDDCPKE